jgi:uncharacterized protein YqgC (DUF456 family)
MHTRGGRDLDLSRQIIGYSSLALGIAGLVLPVIPGVVFILIGLRLLGPDHFLTRPVMDWVERMKNKSRS